MTLLLIAGTAGTVAALAGLVILALRSWSS